MLGTTFRCNNFKEKELGEFSWLTENFQQGPADDLSPRPAVFKAGIFLDRSLLLPSLKIGISLAIFQVSGNILLLMFRSCAMDFGKA